jgi:hypothetical protein
MELDLSSDVGFSANDLFATVVSLALVSIALKAQRINIGAKLIGVGGR